MGLLALALVCCQAVRAKDEAPERTVEDLAYGEVLFYFYQEDYFSALMRLLAAESRKELARRGDDTELLLGGLYLSYGQHRLAGEIFERLLEQSVAPELNDRAWFFLAKIWHQRGYLDDAAAALGRIKGTLPEELEPERRMLHAQVLMEQGQFAAALALLETWPDAEDRWVSYAKYNVGVALVRLGQVEAGAAVLDEIGSLETGGDAELAALRDKANVALGYAWLQANAPAAAKPPLQRVRLDGPYSSKALLGVGWSDAEQSDYRAALAPWVELRGRDLLDSAVQESLLAVPYAYARLGAENQAADYYVQAISAFNDEIARLDTSIAAIEGGELVAELLDHGTADGSGWYWRLEQVPDTIESRYLYELMSTNRFQEALKNYRDVLHLTANLEEWTRSLSAFDDILDTKQRAYAERLPVIEAALDRIDVDALNRERVECASELGAVERNRDIVALGTADEQQQWDELAALEPDLARLGGDARAEELRAKQQFLKGLLIWDLDKGYKERLWRAKRHLRELDYELRSADRLDHRVRTARDEWPETFAEQSARVAALTARVASVNGSAGAVLAHQSQYLQHIAVEELYAQRERLATYLVQARFSLAAIYDRAASVTPPATGEVLAGGAQ